MTDTLAATATFNADWASPPGELIEEVLEEQGWTRAELAQRLDFSAKHVNELLKGRATITADTAERLERVLGHDAGFWLRLEANYQQDLVRLQQLDQLASQKGWLKELPLGWMQRQGWVETCSHAGQQVAACLKFFAVASVDAWRQRYGQPLAVYRTSKSFTTEQGALSLRHKINDHLWFTLFHEAGHLLKHGKKATFSRPETAGAALRAGGEGRCGGPRHCPGPRGRADAA
ncbi:MAG: HigA family addiction module antitoxin [Synechococcaceae cyanobacterium]